MLFRHFDDVVQDIRARLKEAPLIHPPRWQSIDVSDKPHLATYELFNYGFTLDLPSSELDYYQKAILPNLPWADDHFLQERVGGDPLNPGQQWRKWPYAASADTHRRDTQAFDHSYAERYWPRWAGTTLGGYLKEDPPEHQGHFGIRFRYGDLDDLVNLLANEPLTRQAYLPVWFPEDLAAAVEGKRVPCSLGYHFIMRHNRLHVVYPMRSCDFVRHFRDDVYMTIRLLLWILDQCRLAAPQEDWDKVTPGTLKMEMTSLHIFQADHRVLFKDRK